MSAVVLVPTLAQGDDRPPTPELDDGMWEVDDARKAGDNREFDLKLDPSTYKIVVEREDR